MGSLSWCPCCHLLLMKFGIKVYCHEQYVAYHHDLHMPLIFTYHIPVWAWPLISFVLDPKYIIMAPKQSLEDILCLLRFFFFFFFFFLLLFFLSFFRQKFVRHISRRCRDQTWWNLVGISYAMWSCAFKGWFFKMAAVAMEMAKMQKKMKNTKMVIAGYSPNRNWWNLIGTTSTSSETR